MKKLVVLLVVAVLLSSCKSGWSCKKRYVEVTDKKELNQTAVKS